MGNRRELGVAIAQGVCGVGAAGYLTALGVMAEAGGAPGRTLLDRTFPFLLALAVAAALLRMALRSFRRAQNEPPGAPTPDAGPAEHRAAPPATPATPATPTTPTTPASAGAPVLSADGRRELARLVDVLARAGLFAPRVPDPDDLTEAAAGWGEPVTAGAVFTALFEATHWRPGFRSADHLAALAFHDSHAEQGKDTLREQVADLVRLVGDDLDIGLEGVEVPESELGMRTRLQLSLAGVGHQLDYASHPKRLSTVLHQTVAQALRAAAGTLPDRPRLAWVWVDQGVWLAVLRGGVTAEGLDAEIAGDGTERWTWVDEEEPVAAGDQAR